MLDDRGLAFVATLAFIPIALIAAYFAAVLFRWWLRRFLIWVSQFFPDDEENPVDYRGKAATLAQLGFWAVIAVAALWAGSTLVEAIRTFIKSAV